MKRRYPTGFGFQKRKSRGSIFCLLVWKLPNHETKIQKIGFRKRQLDFCLGGCRKFSRIEKTGQCEQFAHLCHFRKWKIGKRNANQQSRGFDGIGQ